jgi:hypothetical protein
MEKGEAHMATDKPGFNIPPAADRTKYGKRGNVASQAAIQRRIRLAKLEREMQAKDKK